MIYRTIFLLLLIAPLAAQAQESDRAQEAQTLVETLLAGDTETVYAQFTDQVKGVITQDQLQQAIDSITAQAGAFQEITDVRETAAEIVVVVQFERAALDAHVVYDADGKVAGLNFTPAAGDQPTPTPNFLIPTYADPSSFTETEVTVGEFDLPGVLTLPNGDDPFPAVVLISGSGPNDRDETVGQNKPFRDLAWGLATQGIATLRFDKRTLAARDSLEMTTLTLKEEYVDDALAAVELLRDTERIDPAKVFVLGHSLGGYVLPRIAAAYPQIAGAIIASGLALPLPETIVRQTRYLVPLGGQTQETQATAIATVEDLIAQINAITPDTPPDHILFGAAPAYWLDMRDYDPAALAATLPQPILVLQGGRDYQVTVADDLEHWREGLADHSDVTFNVYPDLNHLYMTGEGMSTPGEYEQSGNVAQEVIDDIAAWVKAH